MKNKGLRLSALLLAMITTISLFAGCGGSAKEEQKTTEAASSTTVAKEEPKDEFVTLKIIYPGSPSKRMEEFLANEFKEKMETDLNLGLDIKWIPWDQYWNSKDMMLSAGEQIEWYWDGAPGFNGIVGKKACVPIDELVEKYGQDMKKAIPAENFEPFKKDGKLMGIPAQYAPTSEKFNSIVVRKDLMDEVGVKEVKTVDDMEKLYEAVKVKHPEIKFTGSFLTRALLREYLDNGSTYMGVKDMLTYNEDTKKVDCVYLTEGFKKYAQKATEWGKKGWMTEELTVKPTEDVNRLVTGMYLLNSGAISRPIENINDLRKNAPDASLIEFLLAPEKTNYKMLSSTEVIYISPTAKYPDRAMKMINWMYKSKENYMFAIYGVEGKDYNIKNDRIELLSTDSLWYEWMFRNLNYMQYQDNVSDEFIKEYSAWDEKAKISGQFGFVFDGSAVEEETIKLEQIYTELVIPLMSGYIDYEKTYPQLVEKLKKAGIQKYIDTYQQQLDAYIAGK